MFKRVLFVVSLLCCASLSVKAATLKAYIKSFQTANNCAYQTFNFTDSSAYTGTNKSKLKYKWYYSDATTDTGKISTKYFTTTGTFTISLVVINATDAPPLKDSTAKTVKITGVGVLPSFTLVGPHCERSEPVFTITSSFAGNTIDYAVKFGDGPVVQSFTVDTDNSVSHTYLTRGTYKIMIRDSSTVTGCKSQLNQDVVIAPRPFARQPSYNSLCPGLPMTFKVVQASPTDTAGMHVTYNWTFESKPNVTGKPTVTETYNAGGNYNSEIYVINHTGTCSDSLPYQFEVFSTPIVNFQYIPVCQDSLAKLIDQSTDPFSGGNGGNNSWHWKFCDSLHSNCDTAEGYDGFYNPDTFIHGFPHGGTFFVTEYVKTGDGCADSLQKQIYINPIPTTDFVFQNSCVDSALQFVDASTAVLGNSVVAWKWNFGDASSSNLQNPGHQYATPGYNYQVKLISKTQAGCIDSMSKTVIAYPLPTGDFASIPKCVGIQVPFAGTANLATSATNQGDYISHFFWIFGDGGTDSVQNPLHAFKDSGFQTVKMVAYSAHGCADTVTKQVYIFPSPIPSFQLAASNCARDSVLFINNSTVTAGHGDYLVDTSYNWNFGDSITAQIITNPSHLYHYPATFKVTLSVVSHLGCSKDTTIPIPIIPGPVSSFTVGPKCTGEPIQFTNTTTSQHGGQIRYIWNFGDGTTDTAKNPIHTYTASQGYRVRLYSYMPSTGCSDSTPLQFVNVTPRPVAFFNANNTCVDSIVTYVDSSYVPGFAPPNQLQSFTWDFGDGHFGGGIATTHQYAAPGIYKVREYVVSNSGCEDSFIRMVTIYPVPTAKYGYTISCAGTPTPFTDMTAATDSIVSWTWLFSNIDTEKTQNTSHVYQDYDILSSQLTVINVHGCPNTKAQSITILQAPDPSFQALTGCSQRPLSFTGFNNNSAVFNPEFAWNFGDPADPSTDSSYSSDPTHNYSHGGNFLVTLTETSNQGCVFTDSNYVHIEQLPIAGFSYFGSCLGQQYIFADTSQLAQDAISARWFFGQGVPYNGRSGASFQYSSAGTFLVKMAEIDSFCTSDTAYANVVVNPAPTANFGWDTTCFGQPTQLIDSSMANGGVIKTYLWKFGDGSTDSIFPNPYFHNYTDSFKSTFGVYNAQLVVTTNFGCVDTDRQSVVIRQIPYASFTANPDPAVIQNPQVVFSNTTENADPSHYYWTFGDGTDSHDINPIHIYKDTGTFLVTLSADNDYCADTFRYIVYVTPGYTIYAPNCITVNGDNKNDVWMAKGVGVIDFDVIIVDRWGQQVFHSNDINQPWNGDYNGNGVKVPEGVYVYSIKAGDFSNTNFTALKGNITVLR